MTLAEASAVTPTLIAGTANERLSAHIADELGVALCTREIQRFPDGELHVEIRQSVRGRDVYVVQSTSHDVDARLVELLFLADACRRAGAARLTAVVPYFGYARQDRRARGREAVGAAVVANLIEAAGFSRILAIDLHAPAIEGVFRIPVEHLSAVPLLAASLRPTPDSVIVAPDLGAAKLAERYAALLHLPVVVLHKTRVTGSDVSLHGIIGDITDRAPIIIDDMITTGGTIEAAARGLLAAGCQPHLSIAVSHGLFVGPAIARLHALPIRQLATTDSVEPSHVPAHFRVVPLAPLLADAIRRLNRDQSLAPVRTSADVP